MSGKVETPGGRGPSGRANCPVCGQNVAVNRNRELRAHGAPQCEGSGRQVTRRELGR